MKIKCFCSKGAFLLVLWMCLVCATIWSFVRLYSTLFKGIKDTGSYAHIALLPVVPFLTCAPLSGWFADIRFGNYKVFKAGILLTFMATVLLCICVLTLGNIESHAILARVVSGGVSPVVCALGLVGGSICIVTALELGLDQMPDASSARIVNFIYSFCVFIFLGYWISDGLYFALRSCSNYPEQIDQVYSIFPVACMSFVCCSFFIFAPRWLIVEPNCPQSLKTAYRVLKFAAKHKAPLNRSALTYWEINVPSRLDLGKSKYGGPFTTEQVEDVKTFFKLSVIFLPTFVTGFTLLPKHKLHAEDLECNDSLLYIFTYNPWLSGVLSAVLSKCVIYPLLKKGLPSILKRIGFALFVALLLNAGSLAVYATDSIQPDVLRTWQVWQPVVYYITVGFTIQNLLTNMIEFVCAQSPYNMRGLLAGYTLFLFFSALGVGTALFQLLTQCKEQYCPIVNNTLTTALSLLGFVLHCIVAHWYKMRVRDEEYSPHRVVEEIYDRYLPQIQ